jgi:hypothetical protein
MFWDTSSDKVAGVIADWLEDHVDHAEHVPPGLAKKPGDLPPGQAKKL